MDPHLRKLERSAPKAPKGPGEAPTTDFFLNPPFDVLSTCVLVAGFTADIVACTARQFLDRMDTLLPSSATARFPSPHNRMAFCNKAGANVPRTKKQLKDATLMALPRKPALWVMTTLKGKTASSARYANWTLLWLLGLEPPLGNLPTVLQQTFDACSVFLEDCYRSGLLNKDAVCATARAARAFAASAS